MCGIAGIVQHAKHRVTSPTMLRRMANAIVHRGPDEEGYLERGAFGLANRRLSIVGLADGQQPISNEDGTLWVVFNGELYDYKQIRADLEGRGHVFKTTTDTELIPHLFEEYGERAFDRLKGQFAFCLWSSKDDRFILARDRFGICPLYYTVVHQPDGDVLLFASEIKALLASGIVPRQVDLQGINQVFTFFAVPGPMTCFAGIKQLTPGHYLTITRPTGSKEFTIWDRIYWEIDFPDQGDEENPSEEVAIAEYERLFVQSVNRRLQADVPVVSYLSGGVDSSLVTAVASKLLNRPIETFTVGVRTKGFDETSYAKRVADYLGCEMNVCEYTSQESFNDYPHLIKAAEFPVVDSSSASLLRLAGSVRDHGFKVALTGEGSDEFLAGYPWFKVNKIFEHLEIIPGVRVGNWIRAAMLRITGQPRFPMQLMRASQDYVGGHNGWLDVYGMMSLSKLRFYSDDLKKELIGASPYQALNLNTEKMKRWHPFHRGILLGAKIMLAGHLLASKGDRVAMNSSVETRPPFLDTDLVTFTNRLHPRWKLRRFRDKYLLRKVAARWLPSDIAKRGKKMFRAPLDSFHLTAHNPPAWISEVMSAESLKKTGYFDVEEVLRWREQLPNMRRTLAKTSAEMGLMAVLTTQLWHHLYISGNLSSLPSLVSDQRFPEEPVLASAS